MRYKFRAWDKELQKMVYADFWDRNWYGTPQNDENGCHTMYSKNTIKYNCELMQFTGLKDKNGKECYEGDIIRYKYYNLGEILTGIAKVEWDNGAYFLTEINIKRNYPMYLADLSFEIIGNIHQNPELLK